MADINVDNRPAAVGGGSGAWVLGLVAVVALILVAWLLLARPSGDTGVDIDVPEAQAPQPDAPNIEVKVPEKVDVNVKQN
jgi:hypothetical protein